MKSNVRLRMAIWKTGLSQTEIARRAGIGRATLSSIVCGWLNPSEDYKIKISMALGIHPGKLFPKEKERSRPIN